MFAICTLPLCPVRAEASDKSEMVDQLLFGDRITILEKQEKWSRIQCAEYDYTGWVDNKQYTIVDEEQYNSIANWKSFVHEPMMNVSLGEDSIILPMGARLPESQLKQSDNQANEQSLTPIDLAIKLLHSPYLWGGKSCMGIDCSGLTQVVFRVCGQQLPRDASQQARCGQPVATIDDAMPNDLCFFTKITDNPENHSSEYPIIHVGIYMGQGSIIHASGQVRIDRIDSHGIFNAGIGQYTHRLHSIRRL